MTYSVTFGDNCVKTNKNMRTLAVARMYARDSSFWQYRPIRFMQIFGEGDSPGGASNDGGRWDALITKVSFTIVDIIILRSRPT